MGLALGLIVGIIQSTILGIYVAIKLLKMVLKHMEESGDAVNKNGKLEIKL